MLLMFALGAMAVAALAPAALAQQHGAEEDVFDCADFATRTGAQALLGPEDDSKLDDDGDGKACEIGPDGKAEDGTKLAAKTGGDLDCIDFPSQEAAQAKLKAKPSDPDGLDLDNSGVACQIVPVPYEDGASDRTPVAAAKSKAKLDCADFEYQQEAQMILLRDEADPNGLDEDGNGLACEEELESFAANEEVVEAARASTHSDGGLDPWLLLVLAGGLAGPGAVGVAAWRRRGTSEG
ncbi:hypothetical protein GBA65_04290 [Rubrobacter marinus]|uniref:Excalibur calcium-binding domain-containing protein n=1 Tax=Rubrobacter marinus TaxID=2653852 RepID=A0A6G8PU46_9ACTN|nr:hypothetical protein GBA65_04290 [Rubrobacter marinus]